MSFARLPGVFALLFCMSVTGVQARTVTDTGLATDADDAAARALEAAAADALGVAATLAPSFSTEAAQWVQSHGDDGGWSAAPDADWSSLQPLAAFRVLENKGTGEGLFRAKVEVRVDDNGTGDNDATRLSTLLVAPFGTAMQQYPVGGKVPADEVRGQLRRHLETVIAQSGRLNVLDADLDDTQLRAMGPAEQIERGRDLGADLMIVGRIKTFALTTHDKKYMGMQFRTLQPRAVIEYQILNTVTREIIRAGTFSDHKLPKSLKQAFVHLARSTHARLPAPRQPSRVGPAQGAGMTSRLSALR